MKQLKKKISNRLLKKLIDIADDLAEKIEQLTNEADEDKLTTAEKAKVSRREECCVR